MNAFHTPTVSVPLGQWHSNSQIIEDAPRSYVRQGLESLFVGGESQGHVTYIPVSDQCLVQIINGQVDAPYWDRTIVEGWVGFQFALDGEHISVVDGYGQMKFSGPRFSVAANTSPTRVAKLFSPGCNFRYVSIVARPQFLLDQFGVELRQLPCTIQAMLRSETADYFNRTQSLSPEMHSAARELIQSRYEGKLQQTYAKVKSLELLCLAIESLTGSDEPEVRRLKLSDYDIRLLYEVRDKLATSYASPLSLAAMSRQIGMNRNKLSLGFKAIFGSGVYEYCQQLRMQHARTLLQRGSCSILEIALEVGFQNQSSFSRAYKQFYGRSPSQDLACCK